MIKYSTENKYLYQINYTMATCICKRHLIYSKLRISNVEKLLQQYILPIRPRRRDPRKVKPQVAVGFLYRVA